MNLLPQVSFESGETNMVCLLPAIFYMRGETEAGESAGLMVGLTWFGATLSLVWV